MKMVGIQPRQVLIIVFFILLASYALFQARSIILGPRIWIDNPQDGQTVESPLVTIEGRSRNISWISLNDRQIFTDENGRWGEKLIVSEGLSIMTVKARDRFGHETTESVQIILN